MDRTPKHRLDPRRPLVIDTHALGRRPGSMRTLQRQVPAPAGLGLDIVRVPEGAELALDARLESVLEGVLVTATVTGPLTGECARCLEPVARVLEVGIQELYTYSEAALRHQQQAGSDEEEDETGHLDGDLLDLEPALRDAVVLALPLAPLCREDCPGLCAQCGVLLAEAGLEHLHDELDPRWAGLHGLMED